jgi:hypothetical protein
LSLAEVLRAGLPGFARTHRLPRHHWKVLNALQVCHTPLLGGHQYQCAHCHRMHFAPHACGNRHCPSCQGINSRQWLAAQAEVVLPIPYFHLVFTLPHELNPLIQQNQKRLYRLLFASVSETLLTFGRNNLEALLGITAVLHTWSQNLLDHYHLHCIVTGGGLSLDGTRWVSSHDRYLFNVTALSRVFQAKFCEGLQELYAEGQLGFYGKLAPLAQEANFQAVVRQATRHNWVVYSKRPFAGPEQVLAYLSRYTHRAGISNSRLQYLDRTANQVSFDYKDYAQGGCHKTMVLALDEFIRRLCRHILPPHFVKIRHYGLLANRGRQERLERARALLPQDSQTQALERWQFKTRPAVASLPVCPYCGWATLVLVRVVGPQRWRASPRADDTS